MPRMLNNKTTQRLDSLSLEATAAEEAAIDTPPGCLGRVNGLRTDRAVSTSFPPL